MISHFSLFPTPTCLENISFHFRPLLLILVRESVIVEPQLTHLETPICGGHNFVDLFSATSFCYTDLFHLKPWPSTSSWTDSRGGSCICNESFGVPGVSSICLGKTKQDVPYVCVCLSHLGVKLSFHIDPLHCGWGVLCSLSSPKWNLLSKLKVLRIVPQIETGGRKIWPKRQLLNLNHFSPPMPPLFYEQIMKK